MLDKEKLIEKIISYGLLNQVYVESCHQERKVIKKRLNSKLTEIKKIIYES